MQNLFVNNPGWFQACRRFGALSLARGFQLDMEYSLSCGIVFGQERLAYSLVLGQQKDNIWFAGR